MSPSIRRVLALASFLTLSLSLFPRAGVTTAYAQTPVLEAANSSDETVLQVNDGGGLVAPGTFGTGAIPATGAGTRLMWYPAKAAFRAGRAFTSDWDEANIGDYSVALGIGPVASGNYSVALGRGTATGETAVALGGGEATNSYATALGTGEATGEYATAVGFRPTASGDYSVAGGESAEATARAATAFGLNASAQGYASVALGDYATASYSRSYAIGTGVTASDHGAVAIGADAIASGQDAVAIGSGAWAAGGQSIAMGTRAKTTGIGGFAFGDRASGADTVRAGQFEFAVRATSGVSFYTSADLSSGVELTGGSGSWSSLSDSTKKENFRTVDGEAVLEKIAQMPVQSWSYKTQPDSVRHMGPTAQDFHAAFGLGSSDKAIGTVDIDGVNMRAIQALEARTQTLRQENESLRETVTALEQRVAALESQHSDQALAGLGYAPLGLLGLALMGGLLLWRRQEPVA